MRSPSECREEAEKGDEVVTASGLPRRVHPQQAHQPGRHLPLRRPTHRRYPRDAVRTDTSPSQELQRRRREPSTAPVASAMRVARFDGEDAADTVVEDSCDVDMGTPTAAQAKTSAGTTWRFPDANGDTRDAADEELRRRVELRRREWRKRESENMMPAAPRSTNLEGRTALRPRHLDGSGITDSPDEDVEIQPFREYRVDDLENLEILPSQDFDGEVLEDADTASDGDAAAVGSSQPDSGAWLDPRDGTQFLEEEASEVFDNVIYAPPKLPPRTPSSSSTATPPPRQQQQQQAENLDDLYESESELSDGYEPPYQGSSITDAASSPLPHPPCVVPSAAASTASRASSASGSPLQDPAQLCARMSVKRDCSFIDNTIKHRRAHLSVHDLSESGEEFEEKLRLVDGDGDRDRDRASARRLGPPPPSADSASSAVDADLLLPGFRPKKKRRRVRQLALDAFVKVQPGTTI